MPNIVEKNYLEGDYLDDPYLGGQVAHGAWCQVGRSIHSTHQVRSQIKREIDHFHKQTYSQINRASDNGTHTAHEQVNKAIHNIHYVLEQAKRLIQKFAHPVHEQVNRHVDDGFKHKGEEIRRGSVLFQNCETYLEGGYLEDPYLVACFNAHLREQLMRKLRVTKRVHSQINRKITSKHHIAHSQIVQRIDALHRVHEQINRLSAHFIHSQITAVLYNITNLRILLDFPSRGTSGMNWIASSTMTGDFDVNNLNTDIVEQAWRSNTGDKSGVTLRCDTEVPQGVFVDTLAILNHNFTTSASVLWEATNDPTFSTISFTQVLTPTRTNIYYIAPSLPTDAYRYHRFTISDPTSTATYLQVGTIVFGSSIIFQGECFVDQVTRQTIHFADKIATEAFTNISNDRALKFAVGLEFRNLQLNKGNYDKIRDVFDTARTSLKCLWIPTPQYASRYATFAKLEAIPVETHNDLGANYDYVSFSIQTDESL